MRNLQFGMWEWCWLALAPMAVAIAWAASIVSVKPILLGLWAGLLLYLVLLAVSIRAPLVFVTVFIVVLMVLPPFYFSSTGDTPFYVSMLLLPIALAVLLLRFAWRRLWSDPVAKGLAFFLAGTGFSLPFAFWLSGNTVGMHSLLRWLMLAQTVLIYALIRATGAAKFPARAIPLLLAAAVISAGYGIFDFFSPVPLSHPAAPQFIWLADSVVRRAQGVFYESCNFANFCGFFLVVASAALLAREEQAIKVRRPWLVLSIVVLALGSLLAFSRSAWGCVLFSLFVFAAISGKVKMSRAALFSLALGTPLAVLWHYVPEFWNNLVTYRIGYLTRIFVDPNYISSWRFGTWARVASIIQDNPRYLLFGIGYKTLPFTRLFHRGIITDNGFLSLLLETGLLGLTGFLVLSGSVFITFWRLARAGNGNVAFWSALLFSFWCGECLQMMAADAYTYWRNMIVFTAFMAFTLNLSERKTASHPAALASDGEPAI